MSEREILYRYYMQQAGSGIGPIYSGPLYQTGHGIGSLLAKIFRTVSPYIKTGAKKFGKELLKSGLDVANDLDNHISLKEALRNRTKEALQRATKIGGSYKGNAFREINHIINARQRVNTKISKKKPGNKKNKRNLKRTVTRKNKKRNRKEDIFD